jgi:diacylglycerol kinase family enzyme
VVNPAASTYSHRLESAVARELARAFRVELARTEEPGHAIPLGRAGAGDGAFTAVAVLGGDGVVNEVANGLAGSDVPLLALPAGRTNVLSRALDLPRDARSAAAALARSGRRPPTRRIDLGTVNGRVFTFASGVGLSASANRRLTGRGRVGRRLGGHLFLYEALAVGAGYLWDPPRFAVAVEGGEREVEGVTLIAQNADPLTYLGGRALPLCEGAGLETGSISLAILRRASARVALDLTPRVLSGRGAAALAHEHVASLPRLSRARIRTLDGRGLPVEVDGDYVGEFDELEYGVRPRALSVVSGPLPESLG